MVTRGCCFYSNSNLEFHFIQPGNIVYTLSKILSIPAIYIYTCILSVESEAKGIADILDFQEVSRRLHSPLAKFVPPQHAHSLCFWADEQTYDHVELAFGQAVRLKTKGDSPFIGNPKMCCSVLVNGQVSQ